MSSSAAPFATFASGDIGGSVVRCSCCCCCDGGKTSAASSPADRTCSGATSSAGAAGARFASSAARALSFFSMCSFFLILNSASFCFPASIFLALIWAAFSASMAAAVNAAALSPLFSSARNLTASLPSIPDPPGLVTPVRFGREHKGASRFVSFRPVPSAAPPPPQQQQQHEQRRRRRELTPTNAAGRAQPELVSGTRSMCRPPLSPALFFCFFFCLSLSLLFPARAVSFIYFFLRLLKSPLSS